jgi:hypothetical protein
VPASRPSSTCCVPSCVCVFVCSCLCSCLCALLARWCVRACACIPQLLARSFDHRILLKELRAAGCEPPAHAVWADTMRWFKALHPRAEGTSLAAYLAAAGGAVRPVGRGASPISRCTPLHALLAQVRRSARRKRTRLRRTSRRWRTFYLVRARSTQLGRMHAHLGACQMRSCISHVISVSHAASCTPPCRRWLPCACDCRRLSLHPHISARRQPATDGRPSRAPPSAAIGHQHTFGDRRRQAR